MKNLDEFGKISFALLLTIVVHVMIVVALVCPPSAHMATEFVGGAIAGLITVMITNYLDGKSKN